MLFLDVWLLDVYVECSHISIIILQAVIPVIVTKTDSTVEAHRDINGPAEQMEFSLSERRVNKTEQ